jgi:phosphoribosylformylglycinamidine cyclo-ligase
MAKKPLTYQQAGVNIAANTRWVDQIRRAMVSTYGPRVCEKHNAFAGMFRLDYDEQLFRRNYRNPVLVGCTDGVGTKVLTAIQMKKLDTIGIDLVAMNVNDLVTLGAEPLFFLDYLAVHELNPPHLQAIVEGIAEGCRQADCALLGGETAEMPDVYRKGDLDLAGFSVGVVERGREIDGSRIEPGDVLIALPSSGIHSNGYTLVRKLISHAQRRLDQHVDELGETLGEAVLRPTRIYVRAVRAALRAYRVKRVITGMAHITGGGLKENLARVLPDHVNARIRRRSWQPPPIFPYLQSLGTTSAEMWKVFNMGVGYVFVVRPSFVTGVQRALRRAGEQPFILGNVTEGNGKVRFG